MYMVYFIWFLIYSIFLSQISREISEISLFKISIPSHTDLESRNCPSPSFESHGSLWVPTIQIRNLACFKPAEEWSSKAT